jgi:hypothetical protein
VPLRRTKAQSTGIITSGIVTANIVGDVAGVGVSAISLSWFSEPNVNYKMCGTAPTFASNIARTEVQCGWQLVQDQGAPTIMNKEVGFCVTPNAAWYGFSAFEHTIGSGATPPTKYGFTFIFWHQHSNIQGYTTVVPTLKAAADWPFKMWVEKV